MVSARFFVSKIFDNFFRLDATTGREYGGRTV